ncbi:phosphate ABC transporter permease subunit PstC [Gryllotalpicola reticulitermitis]|uniref:Phosphate transport system permease protein n=1 Tax=Gryllotalpicola reticulitermitis TaxID=1184153 RepID=A0ABV8QC28_9MICO
MSSQTAIPDKHDLPMPAGPRLVRQVLERADLSFRAVTRASGALVVGLMVLVGVFLTIRSVEAVGRVGLWEFLTTQQWSPATYHFGVASLVTGTVLIALVALVIAFPLALGVSLFVSEIAKGSLQRVLVSIVDLAAAVPSVIYGLWGLAFLEPLLPPFARWLSTWFGWIPFLAVSGADLHNPLPNDSLYKASTFIAGLVVGFMIVPVMVSLMRESFTRAPIGEREGAYALGATRWGVIRSVVLPFGVGGIIGGSMLGLGRALGETIAIYLIIGPIFQINLQILHVGGNSIAANIASQYGSAGGFTLSALMASGLALFVLTMAVNFTASAIIARSRSGADSEA